MFSLAHSAYSHPTTGPSQVTRPTLPLGGPGRPKLPAADGRRLALDLTAGARFYGNGMFYSMGNLMGNGQVGMLFIDFERQHRLRLQSIARADDSDSLLPSHAEAQLVVRILSPRFSSTARGTSITTQNWAV
jgi:hypothetical protein